MRARLRQAALGPALHVLPRAEGRARTRGGARRRRDERVRGATAADGDRRDRLSARALRPRRIAAKTDAFVEGAAGVMPAALERSMMLEGAEREQRA